MRQSRRLADFFTIDKYLCLVVSSGEVACAEVLQTQGGCHGIVDHTLGIGCEAMDIQVFVDLDSFAAGKVVDIGIEALYGDILVTGRHRHIVGGKFPLSGRKAVFSSLLDTFATSVQFTRSSEV